MGNRRKNSTLKQFLKLASSVITWVLVVLLVIVAGFLLYYFVTSNYCKSKGETCKPKVSLYTIISPSMEPTIKVYDIVINTTPAESDDIEVGDVITFNSTSKLYSTRVVTHRVIEKRISESGLVEFRTQGDNNLSPDDTWVPFNNILGKVAFKIPQLGRVQFLLTSAGGWLFLIIIPALFLVLYDVIKLVKVLNAKNKVETVVKKEQEKTEENEQASIERKETLRKRFIEQPVKKYQKNKNEPTEIYSKNGKCINILLPENLSEETYNYYRSLKGQELETSYEEYEAVDATNEVEDVEDYVIPVLEDYLTDQELDSTKDSIDEQQTTEQPGIEIENTTEPSNEETTESISEEPIEEDSSKTENQNPAINSILARLKETPIEEEKVELPKLISFKEEIIPNDLDLPSIGITKETANNNQNNTPKNKPLNTGHKKNKKKSKRKKH